MNICRGLHQVVVHILVMMIFLSIISISFLQILYSLPDLIAWYLYVVPFLRFEMALRNTSTYPSYFFIWYKLFNMYKSAYSNSCCLQYGHVAIASIIFRRVSDSWLIMLSSKNNNTCSNSLYTMRYCTCVVFNSTCDYGNNI